MSYYIYSHEALPNPEMMGKPRYTPDGDYIRAGGVTLPTVPKQEWMELDEDDPRYSTIRRQDWRDRQGMRIEVPLKRFMPVVKNMAERGVVMLDHKPSPEEAKKIETACEENNYLWRKKQVEFFENQRQIALAKQGQYDPTPYIDECYEILGMRKPYSMEALRAQRDPGNEAALRIANAISEGQKANAEAVANAVADVLTRPKPQEPVAARR